MGRLDEVNLDETLPRREANDRLAHAQRRLNALRRTDQDGCPWHVNSF